jgi:hypothetical protein
MSYWDVFEVAGDETSNRGIYMPTAILYKTSSDALRTFKSSRASCYSGVPVFQTEARHPETVSNM